MFDIPPDPIAFSIGPINIGWYGLCYAIGLAAAYLLLVWLARRAGEDPDIVGNGIIIVAIAALIGGRLYHVIDQWQLYKDNPITAILPIALQPNGTYAFAGFTGLGVPGGILTGTVAGVLYARRLGQDVWRWADVVAPGLFVMQAIGRWGNFFNQELYGPPTTLPWGIKIDCAHRIADYACGPAFPETTHFHPLFLYESLSGVIGAIVLIWLARRWSSRLVAGDLLLIFFVWYGLTRFALEGLRHGNWTFFGIPTAQIVTLAFVLAGLIGLWYRHGPGRPEETAADLLPERGPAPSPEDEEDAFWADEDEDADEEAPDDGELDDVDPETRNESPDRSSS